VLRLQWKTGRLIDKDKRDKAAKAWELLPQKDAGLGANYWKALANRATCSLQIACKKTLGISTSQDHSMSIVRKFLKNESGATAIEYGLIAAGISVAIIATVQGLGTKLNSTFTSVNNALN
jgi:pilus assembly protein Flp/PilA